MTEILWMNINFIELLKIVQLILQATKWGGGGTHPLRFFRYHTFLHLE